MLIEDGTGSASRLGVKDGEVLVTTMSAIQKATLQGDAYAWNTVSYDITAADTILTVRNTSPDRLLVIHHLYMYTDVPGNYDIHIQTIATAFTQTNGAVVVGSYRILTLVQSLNTALKTKSRFYSKKPANIPTKAALAESGTLIATILRKPLECALIWVPDVVRTKSQML